MATEGTRDFPLPGDVIPGRARGEQDFLLTLGRRRRPSHRQADRRAGGRQTDKQTDKEAPKLHKPVAS